MEHDSLDSMCLRAMKVNAGSERVALTAASIIVHAHAIARDRPERSQDALRIIDLARRFYATLPSRDLLREMIDDAFDDIAASPTDRRRSARLREHLVDRVWGHFQHGEDRGTRCGTARKRRLPLEPPRNEPRQARSLVLVGTLPVKASEDGPRHRPAPGRRGVPD